MPEVLSSTLVVNAVRESNIEVSLVFKSDTSVLRFDILEVLVFTCDVMDVMFPVLVFTCDVRSDTFVFKPLIASVAKASLVSSAVTEDCKLLILAEFLFISSSLFA